MNIFEEKDINIVQQEMSTFPKEIIGEILAKLISRIEGEEFVYQEAYHDTYKRTTTVFGSESLKTNTNVIMIVRKKNQYTRYHDYSESDNEIKRLEKERKVLVLDETEYSFTKNISFYSQGRENIKLESFPYIKEFIDLVIKYRIENKIERITKDELELLMVNFLSTKMDLIEENYRKKLLEYQKELEKKIAEKKEQQQRKIEKEKLEQFMEQGVPSSFDTLLEDRIKSDAIAGNQINKLMISYENEQSIATLTNTKTVESTNDMVISEIDINAHIKDYFDDSDLDPHFHGFCDVDIVDDGLMGIVDISNAREDIVKELTELKGKYKIDKIGNKYLRILYLPNKGRYTHKTSNIYSWVLTGEANEKTPTSHKIEWNHEEEIRKMQEVMKELQLLANLDKRQIEMYKQKKKLKD